VARSRAPWPLFRVERRTSSKKTTSNVKEAQFSEKARPCKDTSAAREASWVTGSSEQGKGGSCRRSISTRHTHETNRQRQTHFRRAHACPPWVLLRCAQAITTAATTYVAAVASEYV